MTHNIRTALQNCKDREARTPLFTLDSMKPLVVPVALVAVGATIPFLPGVDSMIQSVADISQRVAENSTFIAKHNPELLYALAAVSGGVAAMLSGVAVLEGHDKKKGLEQARSQEIIKATQNAWTSLTRTNDNLAEQLGNSKNWLTRTLSDKNDVTTDVLANHGLDKNDKTEMVDLARAYQFGVKFAVVSFANEGVIRDVDNLNNPKAKQLIAEGMLQYYKSKSGPSSLISSLKECAGLESKGDDISLMRLSKSNLEAIRDLQVVEKSVQLSREVSGPSYGL